MSLETDICLVWHEDLTGGQLYQLEQLFNAEYRADEGAWNPDAPYGYAPAELHVMAVEGGRVVGHVGTQRRMIVVGDHDVLVAGTGGVLVSPSHRGQGLGVQLLAEAQDAARSTAPADYGYLGCREEVVPFYESCGYKRLEVTERFRSRGGSGHTVEETGAPVMVCSGTRDVDTWPNGRIDLRGRCW